MFKDLGIAKYQVAGVFLGLLLILGAHDAHAGLIVKPPSSLSVISGLVGYWSFDGKNMGTTSAADLSGQGNTGWLTNGPARAIGKIGQALDFDGVNDRVDIGATVINTSAGGDKWSISVWIFPRTLGESSVGRILANQVGGVDGDADFYVSANNVITVSGDNGTTVCATGTNDFALNQWNHIVFVRTGTDGNYLNAIYVNGVDQISDTTCGNGNGTNPSNWDIGNGGRDVDTQTFDGTIDEVRIYNRTLNEDEIRRLYNMGR